VTSSSANQPLKAIMSLQGISDELKARVLDILHSIDAEPGSQEQREQADRAIQLLEDMKPKKPERPPGADASTLSANGGIEEAPGCTGR